MLSLTSSSTFITPFPFSSRRPRRTSSNSPRCTLEPPEQPQPPSTLSEIPGGARLEPSPRNDSPLERSLARIRFGYEGAFDTDPASSSSSPATLPCKLRYRCAHGHLICARRGSPACRMCPTCCYEMSSSAESHRGRRLSLCQVQALAYTKGGSLVSTEYRDARTPLVWRCAKGHLWKARVTNIRNAGSWCPECARQKKKLSIDDMREIAREKGGECLTDEYISEHVKLRWRCREGHEFLLAPNNIRRKPNGARKPTWCKICAKKKAAREREARARVGAVESKAKAEPELVAVARSK